MRIWIDVGKEKVKDENDLLDRLIKKAELDEELEVKLTLKDRFSFIEIADDVLGGRFLDLNDAEIDGIGKIKVALAREKKPKAEAKKPAEAAPETAPIATSETPVAPEAKAAETSPKPLEKSGDLAIHPGSSRREKRSKRPEAARGNAIATQLVAQGVVKPEDVPAVPHEESVTITLQPSSAPKREPKEERPPSVGRAKSEVGHRGTKAGETILAEVHKLRAKGNDHEAKFSRFALKYAAQFGIPVQKLSPPTEDEGAKLESEEAMVRRLIKAVLQSSTPSVAAGIILEVERLQRFRRQFVNRLNEVAFRQATGDNVHTLPTAASGEEEKK